MESRWPWFLSTNVVANAPRTKARNANATAKPTQYVVTRCLD